MMIDKAALIEYIAVLRKQIERLSNSSHRISNILNINSGVYDNKMSKIVYADEWNGNNYDDYMELHKKCMKSIDEYIEYVMHARSKIELKICELEEELARCEAELAAV